jgi:hypothetical protein
MSSVPPEAETILFRPSKKRKIYRQRNDALDDDEPSSIPTSPPPAASPPNPQSIDELIASGSSLAPATPSQDLEETPVSISEILRLRKKNTHKRVGGVEFRAEPGGHILRDEDGALVLRKKDGEEEGGLVEVESGVPRKFAPQTGTVGDVNKHM